MFTPITKKYCKEPSVRYSSKELPVGKTGLHRSVGRDIFGPVPKKSGAFNNGVFRNNEIRLNTDDKRSQMPYSLFYQSGSLGSLQKEPVTSGSSNNNKYWAEHQQKANDFEEKDLKYANTGSSSNRGVRNYFSPGNDKEKGYGNQVLTLRAELSEKELQLVEIQQQHNKLICRSTDAFKKLEVAIKTKDQVIWQLHQALQSKQDDIERNEKLFDEEKYALLQTTQEKKNTELEQKDAEIVLLHAKNASQLHELQKKEETIGNMKHRLHEKEKSPPPQYMLDKIDTLIGQVQSLECSLQNKDIELESHKKLCNELKTLVWKRECMIGQLQVTEQQLQASLKRQSEAFAALEMLKDNLYAEKLQTEKDVADLKKELQALGSAAVEERQLKEGLKVQEAILHNQRRQIHELQRYLHAKDAALNSQSRKFQLQHEENQKLVEDYEMLKQEYAALKHEKEQLELRLANLDEIVPTKIPRNVKPEYPTDQEIVEISVEDEKELIPTPKVLTPKIAAANNADNMSVMSPNNTKTISSGEGELLSIEEEIGKREKEWRQTEAKMRAELCRRIAQLNELENYHPEPKQETAPGRSDCSRSQSSGKKRNQYNSPLTF